MNCSLHADLVEDGLVEEPDGESAVCGDDSEHVSRVVEVALGLVAVPLDRTAARLLRSIHEDADLRNWERLDTHAKTVQQQRQAFSGEEVWINWYEDQIASRQD